MSFIYPPGVTTKGFFAFKFKKVNLQNLNEIETIFF